jgi:predicted HicB family RNase H-like nuclease
MKSKVFDHRGYTGSVEFSIEDGVLFGQILFINDLVNYEADNLTQLKRAFEEAVDGYLEVCAEQGQEPDKPCSGTFNVRVSPDLHRAVLIEAARRGISLNDFVRSALDHETCNAGRVEIHNHEHHHTHAVELRAEATATFSEPPKWVNQRLEANWQH